MTAGPNLGKSIWAVIAGFLVVIATSLGTDEILHLMKVYPPWRVRMDSPALNALALGYRLVYGLLGNLIIYHLAPWKPMKHVWIGAAIGLVISTLGAIAGIKADLGPAWYPIALAATVLPLAWLTEPIHRWLFPST